MFMFYFPQLGTHTHTEKEKNVCISKVIHISLSTYIHVYVHVCTQTHFFIHNLLLNCPLGVRFCASLGTEKGPRFGSRHQAANEKLTTYLVCLTRVASISLADKTLFRRELLYRPSVSNESMWSASKLPVSVVLQESRLPGPRPLAT